MARQQWKEWTQNKENLSVLTAWARAGYNDEEIADRIGISRSTLAAWKKKYESVSEALYAGKDFSNALVEHSLFQKTQGYEVTVKKPVKLKKTYYDETGRKEREEEVIEYAEETKYIEPDIKAIMFWLKNRKPDEWKEKVLEKDGENEDGTGVIVLTSTQIQELKERIENEEDRGE